MIADVVDVGGLALAVLDACEDAADVGLALGARTERRRIGQQRFEELYRHDLPALVHYRRGGQHADVLQTLHVRQIALPERHEEADALDPLDVLGERLYLFVMEQIHVLDSDTVKVVLALYAHRRDLDPLAVLPIRSRRGNFAQIDLGIEVGRERIAVVAAVAVEDVDGLDRVEQMLLSVRAEHLRHARVEARTEQRGQARLLELLLVVPLPRVVEQRGEALLFAPLLVPRLPDGIVEIFGLVVGGVHIVDAAFEAGVHDRQVLIGKSDVHHEVGLDLANERDERVKVVRVHLGGGYLCRGLAFELRRQVVALGLGAAGDDYLAEHVAVHAALADRDGSDPAAADDQNFCHFTSPLSRARSTIRARSYMPRR